MITAPLRLARELRKAAKAGGRAEWTAGARDWLFRSCCHCGLLIFPLSRHHRIAGRRGVRRIHYARCPCDPATEWTPTDVWIQRVNSFLAGVAMLAFAVAMYVLVAVLAGWTP